MSFWAPPASLRRAICGPSKKPGIIWLLQWDPNDSVGILDSHFPNAAFFTEFEELARFVGSQADLGQPIDYFSVCSPNHLHEAHISAGLKAGANVVCEKLLVLNVDAIDRLLALETSCKGRTSTILQLRLHPTIIGFRDEMVRLADAGTKTDMDLTYMSHHVATGSSNPGKVRRKNPVALPPISAFTSLTCCAGFLGQCRKSNFTA